MPGIRERRRQVPDAGRSGLPPYIAFMILQNMNCSLLYKKTDYPVPEKPHCRKGLAPKVGFILFPTCDHLVQNGGVV
jgi:hypothetical protein